MSKQTVILLLGVLLMGVVGYLFASRSIDSLVFKKDGTGVELKIDSKDESAQTEEKRPSMEIKAGNIEDTGGSVQVGTNQTIGSTDENKKAAPTSPAGDTSISVGNVKGTKGNVQIGSNQTIHSEKPKSEK